MVPAIEPHFIDQRQSRSSLSFHYRSSGAVALCG
jgi:hypothetical protein